MYLFFDVETTGLIDDYNIPVESFHLFPRIVQFAFLLADETEQVIELCSSIIKPDGFEIPAEAAGLHGITTERAAADGCPIASVLCAFESARQRAKEVIAHNVSFDRRIVGAEMVRAGMPDTLHGMERTCTMKASVGYCQVPKQPYQNTHGKWIRGGGYKWPTLSELHRKLFGRDFDDQHTGDADVAACMRSFFELKRRGVLRKPTIPQEKIKV